MEKIKKFLGIKSSKFPPLPGDIWESDSEGKLYILSVIWDRRLLISNSDPTKNNNQQTKWSEHPTYFEEEKTRNNRHFVGTWR